MNQNNNIYQQPLVIKNASYYRTRARDLLKGNWKTAILIAFLAVLLGGMISGGFSFNFDITDLDLSGDSEEFSFDGSIDTDFFLGDFTFDFVWGILLAIIATAVITTVLYSIFVASPIKLGYQRINLDLVDGEELLVKKLFSYFKISYLKSVALNLLYGVVTSLVVLIPALLLVGSLFGVAYNLLQQLLLGNEIGSFLDLDYTALFVALPLIIVAIILTLVGAVFSTILSYTYRFSYMILAEYPHMSAVEAMRVSRTMMKGHKWRLFCLDISFIGWFLLAVFFTLGIGTLVVFPYREAAFAAFYDDVAHRSTAKETEFPSLDPDDYEASADEATDFTQANPDFGMPFTGEVVFPSLNLDDYAPTEEEKKDPSDAPTRDGEETQ